MSGSSGLSAYTSGDATSMFGQPVFPQAVLMQDFANPQEAMVKNVLTVPQSMKGSLYLTNAGLHNGPKFQGMASASGMPGCPIEKAYIANNTLCE